MGIFRRLFKIGEAGANNLVDKLEDPNQMLDQAIRDLQQEIASAQKDVESVVAEELRAKALVLSKEQAIEEWTKKAQLAADHDKDEMAMDALSRVDALERELVDAKTNRDMLSKNVTQLKAGLAKFKSSLEELRANKRNIVAKTKMAQVNKSFANAKTKLSKKSGTDDLIARMKAKADQTQFEAQAAMELAGQGEDSLEKRFEELESGPKTDLKARLAAMKKGKKEETVTA